MAHLTIPVTSYTEYSGSIINCDNILQRFTRAISTDEDLMDVGEIAAGLGSPLHNVTDIFSKLQQLIAPLKELTPETIPEQGLNLNDSEGTNVTA